MAKAKVICAGCDGDLAYGRDWGYCAKCKRYRHIIRRSENVAETTRHTVKSLVQCVGSRGQPILLTPAAAAFLEEISRRQPQEERQG